MFTPEERLERIERIRRFPAELEAVVKNLSEAELRTVFIEGEWTVAQNVHHLAESHMNAFIRIKLLLTENHPTVKDYDQDDWAKLADYDLPIEISVNLLKALHPRLVALFESLTEADWERKATHPAIGEISPESILEVYSDHGVGHIDQINRTLAAGRKAAV